ncbi:MAG: hypothetical protein P9L99_08420 [Candidatus Lernaella stagnicola]|nr:hypothetical protein [Candidatus Lernaella stagnicola]
MQEARSPLLNKVAFIARRAFLDDDANRSASSSEPLRWWEIAFLACLLIVAWQIRGYVFERVVHLDGESVFRAADAVNHSADPWDLLITAGFSGSGTGGQNLFYAINAALAGRVEHPVQAMRQLALFFGIGILVPFFFWIRRALNRRTALLSATLLAAYVPHVVVSAVPMAPAGALFFAAFGGWFLRSYLHAQRNWAKHVFFVAAALSLALATAFRIEAWLLPFLFAAFMWREKGTRMALFFLAVSCSYIVWQLSLNVWLSGRVFGFFETNFVSPFQQSGRAPTAGPPYPSDLPIWSVWLVMLRTQLGVAFLALAFVGSVTAFIRRRGDVFAAAFLMTLFILTARGLIGGQTTYERYSLFIGVFALPLGFIGLETVLDFASRHRLKAVMIDLASIVLAVSVLLIAPGEIDRRIPHMNFGTEKTEFVTWASAALQHGDVCTLTISNEFFMLAVSQKKLAFDMVPVDAPGPSSAGFAGRDGSPLHESEEYRRVLLHAPGAAGEMKRQLFMLRTPAQPAAFEVPPAGNLLFRNSVVTVVEMPE